MAERIITADSNLFGDRPSGVSSATGQGIGTIGGLVLRESYVLAYIDGFWIVAWTLAAAIALVLLLKQPPPNPLTPPRIRK